MVGARAGTLRAARLEPTGEEPYADYPARSFATCTFRSSARAIAAQQALVGRTSTHPFRTRPSSRWNRATARPVSPTTPGIDWREKAQARLVAEVFGAQEHFEFEDKTEAGRPHRVLHRQQPVPPSTLGC